MSRSDDPIDRVRRALELLWDFKGMTPSDHVMRAWVASLMDLSIEQLEQGIQRFIRESTEYPTPALIRRYSGSPAAMTDAERAEINWSSVRKAIRCYGSYRSIDFEDRLVNATIREMGGWSKLCGTVPREMEWRKKDFVRIYQIVATAGIGDASPLHGLNNNDQSPKGLDTMAPAGIESRLQEHPTVAKLEYRASEGMRMLEQRKQLALPDFSVPGEEVTDEVKEDLKELKERVRPLKERRPPPLEPVTVSGTMTKKQFAAHKEEQRVKLEEFEESLKEKDALD